MPKKPSNKLLEKCFKRVSEKGNRRFIYACPYTLSNCDDFFNIMIAANDPGEALDKAKQWYRDLNAKAKEKLRAVWGKPRKVHTNKNYKGV